MFSSETVSRELARSSALDAPPLSSRCCAAVAAVLYADGDAPIGSMPTIALSFFGSDGICILASIGFIADGVGGTYAGVVAAAATAAAAFAPALARDEGCELMLWIERK